MSNRDDNNHEQLRLSQEGEIPRSRLRVVGTVVSTLETYTNNVNQIEAQRRHDLVPSFGRTAYSPALDALHPSEPQEDKENIASLQVSAQQTPDTDFDLSKEPDYDAGITDQMAADLSHETTAPELTTEAPAVNTEAQEQAALAADARQKAEAARTNKPIEELTNDNFAIFG